MPIIEEPDQPDALTPAGFRRRLRIDTAADGPQLLDDALDGWQAKDFARLDPAWQVVAGQGPQPGALMRAYLERPRGHSKTLDLAVMASWLLFAAKEQRFGVAAAADKDQARLLRDAIAKLCSLNPWLADVLDVQAYKVTNRHTGSSLEILSADVASSYGLTPNFVLVDELTHWSAERGAELWHSLFSAAAKRADCLLVIIANAGNGEGESWQWKIREAARTDGRWYFRRLKTPRASWISDAMLDEQERILPPSVFARLWLNDWQSGGGDGIPADAIERAIDQKSAPSGLPPGSFNVILGLDLGVKRNFTGIAICANNTQTWKCHLLHTTIFRPPARGVEVDLAAVEQTLVGLCLQYQVDEFLADQHQGAYILQRIRARRCVKHAVKEVVSSVSTLQLQATVLLNGFRNRRVSLYRDSQLVSDLRKMSIQERVSGNGFRLVSPVDSDGNHGDLGAAFALAATHCLYNLPDEPPPGYGVRPPNGPDGFPYPGAPLPDGYTQLDGRWNWSTARKVDLHRP